MCIISFLVSIIMLFALVSCSSTGGQAFGVFAAGYNVQSYCAPGRGTLGVSSAAVPPNTSLQDGHLSLNPRLACDRS